MSEGKMNNDQDTGTFLIQQLRSEPLEPMSHELVSNGTRGTRR